ncbi:speckle-type POZ protein B-like [Planococcus citri]|uniref:speckle-type POZ protein B-like n=1 Tax=Planococcus citri TaxID=170843 RepID=UPI0031F9AF12
MSASELSCKMNDDVTTKRTTFVVENWCHTRSEVNYCNFMWTIHQYSEYHFHRSSSSSINSSNFKSAESEDYVWSLQLSTPNDKKMIRLYLLLDSDPELSKKVLVKCKMSVINANGEETHIRQQNNYVKLSIRDNLTYLSFKDFLNGNDFLQEETSLLRNGALTIFCEVHFFPKATVTTNCTSNKFVATLSKAREGCDLHRDLERLFEDEEFSDFTILVGDAKYHVHKIILAARSKFFASMFKRDKERNRNTHVLEVTNTEPDVLVETLRFIYTGRSSKLEEMAFDLLTAADTYDLEGLKTLCEHQLVKELTVENAADCLIWANLHHAAFLKEQAIQYIRFNIEAVKKSENWFKIAQSELLNDVFNALFP